MKSFKDNAGRDWLVEITIGQVKRVRDLAGVDLYKLFDDEAQRLFTDPVKLVDTLYVICATQVAERKMSDEEFGRSFDGNVLEDAAKALLDAVIDFFPRSRSKLLRATVEKSEALAEQVQEQALAKINSLTLTDLLTPTGLLAPSAA